MRETIIKFLYNYFNFKNTYYIYCTWVWILSLLFLLNISPYSLLYSTLISFILAVPFQLFIKKDLIYNKLFTIFLEGLFLLLNYYKHFYVNKYKFFDKKQILFNIYLLFIYNIFLLLNKTNMYKLYMIDNIQMKKNI